MARIPFPPTDRRFRQRRHSHQGGRRDGDPTSASFRTRVCGDMRFHRTGAPGLHQVQHRPALDLFGLVRHFFQYVTMSGHCFGGDFVDNDTVLYSVATIFAVVLSTPRLQGLCKVCTIQDLQSSWNLCLSCIEDYERRGVSLARSCRLALRRLFSTQDAARKEQDYGMYTAPNVCDWYH